MEAVIYWLTSLAALVGVWLNIKKCASCFVIWAATNAVWTYVDLVHGIYPQAALQAVYCALSVYGICCWTRKKGADARGR